jgi:hypothetical protein
MVEPTWTITRAARLAAVVLALLLLAGCADEDGPGAHPAPTRTTAHGADTVTSAVYFLVDTRLGVRLARELRSVDATDPAASAVRTMIAGPTDPDYTTTWASGTRVLSVRRTGGVIEVDLSAEARRANAGSEAAARMVQQLVYTVTEVLGRSLPVQLLIDGEPAGELWGVLAWDRPVGREPAVDVRMLVQIDRPSEGTTLASPVTVEGTAAVFEAQFSWQVLSADGAVVAEGVARTDEGQRFAPWSFTVPLARGRYVVQVEEQDPSGGQAGTPQSDTRTVTVE